ncbi:hypothetical protein ECANGB1_2315 [Enterospora canceri]|uniref:Uncharacterized protein n=1 Tax=Enterospora canceri TaxID=1081671 RepID=A0A1Y1S4Q9_9MICR|nr:hypothetical protein ECANGB1_2315 [Enterospora canceri]
MTKKFDNFSILLKEIMDEESSGCDESLDNDILCIESKEAEETEQIYEACEEVENHQNMAKCDLKNIAPGTVLTIENGEIKLENTLKKTPVETKSRTNNYYTSEELSNMKIEKRKDNSKIINVNKKKRKIRPCRNYDD